ncbi:MAG TPA: calcium/sodium antiporter [Thermoanaerobaculia bacterium]|nr:calcium/sodium antiporter [Thermoanaerobaculia bacterium]
MLSILLLLGGLALLLGGGAGLVRGAAGLARKLGVSPLIVGLTVVAFGTSTPELAVNLIAVYRGATEVAFGNIVGSNLANLGLILGLAALVRPLVIHGQVLAREIPMMVLAAAVLLVLALDPALRGEPGAIDRGDGLALLLVFSVFLYAMVGDVVRQRRDPLVEQARERGGESWHEGVPADLLLVAGGIVGLVAGGRLTVDAATELALLLGVPATIIGLTIVAVGTSLPELVTSAIATWRGESDIAVGNVVGSNVFNTLFVLGVTATTRPVPVPAGGTGDLIACVVLSVVLLPMGITHSRRIVRVEGALLLSAWIAYTIWRSAGAVG